MADLKTRYMGMELKNPLIAGASSMTANLDIIRRLEDSGASAIVAKSLFEEEITIKNFKFKEELHKNDELYSEMTTIFPELEHAGPDEHLMWIEKTKDAVSIPVIGSVNAVSPEVWSEYAQKLEKSGVDALELNFFATPLELSSSAADIEKEQIKAVKDVKKNVNIPVSVKLSQFYTNTLNVIKEFDKAGVDGVVIFNRMFHPSIDIEKEASTMPFNLTNPNDHRLSLRSAGLLYDTINASICASHGIHHGHHAIEVLLAGADCFQVVSTLYKNSLKAIASILQDVSDWMDKKSYKKIDDFKGTLSRKNNPDKLAYKRAQYVKLLLNPKDYLETD